MEIWTKAYCLITEFQLTTLRYRLQFLNFPLSFGTSHNDAYLITDSALALSCEL